MLVFAQGENLDFIFQCCPQKNGKKYRHLFWNKSYEDGGHIREDCQFTYRCETTFQKRRRFQIGFMVTCRNFFIICLRQHMGISVLVVDCPLGVANHRLDFEFSWVELILVFQCLIRNRCLLYWLPQESLTTNNPCL